MTGSERWPGAIKIHFIQLNSCCELDPSVAEGSPRRVDQLLQGRHS